MAFMTPIMKSGWNLYNVHPPVKVVQHSKSDARRKRTKSDPNPLPVRCATLPNRRRPSLDGATGNSPPAHRSRRQIAAVDRCPMIPLSCAIWTPLCRLFPKWMTNRTTTPQTIRSPIRTLAAAAARPFPPAPTPPSRTLPPTFATQRVAGCCVVCVNSSAASLWPRPRTPASPRTSTSPAVAQLSAATRPEMHVSIVSAVSRNSSRLTTLCKERRVFLAAG
ncbi:uncharacterized protein LOC129598779 isoform X1 [Paramacrobiotus metropolitanus]|uniref:uncharacterized protein LOC129598779 isoform X1 n=1 Tax=Paramacrobiotus metropolitanus TaxID=2943436 RepID=UPI002445F448|nr:uncharacterized protein LOC129598779 isoform X1 [Paramacrobiotus metropolitanus]